MKKIITVLVLLGFVRVTGLHQVIAGFVLTANTGTPNGACGFGFGYDNATGYGYGYGTACATAYLVQGGGKYTPYGEVGGSRSTPTSTTFIPVNDNTRTAVIAKNPIDTVGLDSYLLKNKVSKPAHMYTPGNRCLGAIVGKFDIIGTQNSVTLNLAKDGKTKYQFFPMIQSDGSYSVSFAQGKRSIKPGTYDMRWSATNYLGTVDTGMSKVSVTNHCKKIIKKKVLPMTGVAFIQ